MEQNNTQNPVNEVVKDSLENLKTLIDVNTIIGDQINTPDGTTIIPISKVSFGFAAGGSEIPTSKTTTPFGGGSGGGVTITPIAFLVIAKGEVKILEISTADNTADRVVNMVPQVVDKVSELINNKKEQKAKEQE